MSLAYIVQAIKLSSAAIVGALLLAGCSTSRTPASIAADTGDQVIDQISLVAIPMALNLDRRPGVDGFGVKVYGLSLQHAKPRPLRHGTLEILMFDGLLPPGTNAVAPRCTWSYTAQELRRYELRSTIGLAYQIAPRWGTNQPSANRITVMARYKPTPDTLIESAPSVITVPQ